MTTYTDRIKPDDVGLTTYIESLMKKKYQIPTFQRDVVWEKDNVKKLWDSIYKFYPFGSILTWRTSQKLHKHKDIGGHLIDDEFERSEYVYILDGQQRTTSLVLSLLGGKIKGRDDFKPLLYVDLTIDHCDEVDDESYKRRFLFWDEIDDKNGYIKANSGRKQKHAEGLIVKLNDIKQCFGTIEKNLNDKGYLYESSYRSNLRRFKEVLDNYRVPLIELKGIQVSEVCQIFERINRAGKPLDIFDIVVAKTYRSENADDGKNGFYLREIFENFRKDNSGNYVDGIDDRAMLEMLSISIRRKRPDSNILNITETYLSQLRTEDIEFVWEETKKAILKTYDFFDNHLCIKGPNLIPSRYFYLTILAYFIETKDPDYTFLIKYFWFYSFHNSDLLSNTTHLRSHISFLLNEDSKERVFDNFLIDKEKLRSASYSSKGRISRAILSLFSSNMPRDWGISTRFVLNNVYYLLNDKPNLHHIFPLDFIDKNPGKNKCNVNSLMNIAYLTQLTNIKISNKNPLFYLLDYDNEDFSSVLDSHFIPQDILAWARSENMPEDALDIFIEKRVDYIIGNLKRKLAGIPVNVIDTLGDSPAKSF